jgi:hypothetical protein
MQKENISKLEDSIEKLKNKESRIYFLVQDTKGQAKASLAHIYNMALVLKGNGFNPVILHEANDYVGVGEWLGSEYMDQIPHKSLQNQNLEVSPEDLLVIPELYGFVMNQVTKLPCGKIVLCQAYDHIFETLQPGQTWGQLGFHKCITTSEFQKEYISNLMRNASIDVIEPIISEEFVPQRLPAKPIIAIHTREPRDAANIIKSFYIKFPQYRWVTFRDMRGIGVKDFANELQNTFLSVWVDETSGYGTFPLESMKSNVPVLGVVPNLMPHWMNEDNGFWISNKLQIVDFIADILQNWLEDNIGDEIFIQMKKTVEERQSKDNFRNAVNDAFTSYQQIRLESFINQLEKLKETE